MAKPLESQNIFRAKKLSGNRIRRAICGSVFHIRAARAEAFAHITLKTPL